MLTISENDQKALLALGALAGLVALVGSMLPWVTASAPFGSVTGFGKDGVGVTTGLIGVVAVVITCSFLVKSSPVWIELISFVALGLGSLLVGFSADVISNLDRIPQYYPEWEVIISVHDGLRMVLIGGIVLMLCAGLSVYSSLRNSQHASQPKA